MKAFRLRPSCTTCGVTVDDRALDPAQCRPCRRALNQSLLLRVYGVDIRNPAKRGTILDLLDVSDSLFAAWWSGRSPIAPDHIQHIEEHADARNLKPSAKSRSKEWRPLRRGEFESPDGTIWARRWHPMSGTWTPYKAGTDQRIGDTNYPTLVALVADHG